MEKEPHLLEKQAHLFLAQDKLSEAYRLFKEAGRIYKENGNHKEAALCLASAASSWARRSGEKAFLNAAEAYEEAALEAKDAGDFQYASLLYKFAAINYERDLEFINFSESFYASRECFRRFLAMSIFEPGKVRQIRSAAQVNPVNRGAGFLQWLWLSLSFLFWGHGERPFRTLFFALFIIFGFALVYTQSYLLDAGAIARPGLLDAFYFSVITFTTVGFGDFVPAGIAKIPVMLEAFCGLFTVSLFVVGLSRKYLRI